MNMHFINSEKEVVADCVAIVRLFNMTYLNNGNKELFQKYISFLSLKPVTVSFVKKLNVSLILKA